jgi:excisionase family DNA binding protein
MTGLDGLVETIAAEIAAKVEAKLRLDGWNGVKPRLLTVKDAAIYMRRSPSGLRRLIHAGKIPMVRLDERTFIDIRDLDRVIEESKETAV